MLRREILRNVNILLDGLSLLLRTPKKRTLRNGSILLDELSRLLRTVSFSLRLSSYRLHDLFFFLTHICIYIAEEANFN